MALGKSVLVLGATGWLTRRRWPPQYETNDATGAAGLIFTSMALEQKDGPKLTLLRSITAEAPS